jgi:hypothetical protein
MFNRLAVGRLRSLLHDLAEKDPSPSDRSRGPGPDGDGWVPFDGATGEVGEKRRKDFLDHLPRYRRSIRRQSEIRDDPDCMTSYHVDMLRRLESRARSLGAEPIFILSPATRPRCEVHEAYRQGLLPTLFPFDDASRFPRLYKVENRFDAEHVNRHGAEIYTRLLADRFAEHLDELSEGERR